MPCWREGEASGHRIHLETLLGTNSQFMAALGASRVWNFGETERQPAVRLWR